MTGELELELRDTAGARATAATVRDHLQALLGYRSGCAGTQRHRSADRPDPAGLQVPVRALRNCLPPGMAAQGNQG